MQAQMQKIKLMSKISTILLFMLSLWVTVPAGFCRAGQQSFTVQVMSGSDKEAALRFTEELIHKGFDASMAEVREKEKPAYKVRVGSFIHRKDAAQLYEALRVKGIEGWVTQVMEPPAQKNDEEKTAQAEPQPHETAAEKNAQSEPGAEVETEAQAEPAPAEEEKPFVLIINPVPTFAEKEPPAATAPTEKASQEVSQPATTYKYFNSGDNSIRITTSLETVPEHYRRHIEEIAVYPVYFKSVNLQDLSMKMAIQGANKEVLLEGITQPVRVPSAQTISDFEAALGSVPLRIKYYPKRTDPDGTLHGSLFFRDGASVERDMVLRGLAACADDNLAWFQNSACSDTAGQTSGQTRQSAEPKQ
jgi:hypothetical protein